MREWPTVARTVQQYSFYLLLFMLPISKAAIEILFPILFLGWLVEHAPTCWQTSLWRSRASRWILVTLLGYLIVCGLSIVTSTYPALSIRGFVGKTLEYALFFLVAADVGRTPGVAERGVVVIMASAGVVGLDSVVQEVIGRDLLLGHTKATYYRMTGPYENPIDLATYLAVVVPLILFQLEQTVSRRWRWVLWGLLCLIIGCLSRTISLGAWMSLCIALGIMVLQHRKLRRFFSLVTGGLLISEVVALQVHSRLERLMRFSNVGVGDRLFMWRSAWHMIQDRPLLGQGLNTFMANYLKYWVGGEQQPRYAHNCFLQIAAETGVVGLLTFVLFLGVMIWRWWRTWRLGRQTQLSLPLGVALAGGLIGFLVQSGFDTNLYSLRQATLFWTLAGVTTGLSVRALRGTGDAQRPI